MRQIPIFFIYIFCFFVSTSEASSQVNDYKNDYAAIDKLTKGLKTYNIKLITKDTTANFPNGDQGGLLSAFKFLKGKKYVYKNADITFNVFIDDISHQYPTTTIEQLTERISTTETRVRNRYKIFSNYELSIRLQAITNTGAEYNIPLVANKQYQKIFYIDDPSFRYNMGTIPPNIGSITDNYYEKFTIDILNFIKDFNAALIDYR